MSENKVLVLKNQAVVNYDNLDAIINEIMNGLDNYNFDLDMIYTHDDIKTLKTLLASYRKKVKAVNDERIAFKKEYMIPYDEVHNKIKNELTVPAEDKFAKATKIINDFEDNLKKEKENEDRKHFNDTNGLPLVKFEQLDLKINLSTSVDNLKKSVDEQLSRIANDIALLELQEHKDRMLVEYFKHLDSTKAILDVTNAIKQEQALASFKEQADNRVVKTEVVKQAEQVEKAKLKKFVFRIECTNEELNYLRQFLSNGRYEFDYKEVLS